MTTAQPSDVTIIGAGAAGLSAGLVLARAQLSVTLIDSGHPRNAPATEMHGFISRDGMPPLEFLAAGRAEVAAYGAHFVSGRATGIERNGDGFAVNVDGARIESRAILVATGLRDELPDLPGVRERWGKSLQHCPYCHGFEVLGTKVVIAAGPIAAGTIHRAGLLRRYSSDLTVITNGIEHSPDDLRVLDRLGARIVEGDIAGFEGPGTELEQVRLVDGSAVDAETAFIAAPQVPIDGLLRELGCDIHPATGFVSVNEFGQTSVDGVWAAGNVVTPNALVITAAGAGSIAATTISGWLLAKDLGLPSPMQHVGPKK